MANCALCGSEGGDAYQVTPREDVIALCPTCRDGVHNGPKDVPHWRCLNDAIWSVEPAIKVVAYRVLTGLDAGWARDLRDIAYLDEDEMAWAAAEQDAAESMAEIVHRDSNGAVLAQGDSVVLIKDLPVKGAGFTAKRGTAVRNISLVQDNGDHIEGRVEGQRIVILTQFVKRS